LQCITYPAHPQAGLPKHPANVRLRNISEETRPCELVSFAEGVVTMGTSGWLNQQPASVVQSTYSATAIEQEARHAEPLLLSRTVLGAP
jgi:hypothetical protein